MEGGEKFPGFRIHRGVSVGNMAPSQGKTQSWRRKGQVISRMPRVAAEMSAWLAGVVGEQELVHEHLE